MTVASLLLFRSSLYFFNNVSWLSAYRPLPYLVKFILKYFMYFNAIIISSTGFSFSFTFQLSLASEEFIVL